MALDVRFDFFVQHAKHEAGEALVSGVVGDEGTVLGWALNHDGG